MTSQSRLLQLPLELVQLIAEHAGADTVLILRLICKDVHEAVLDVFARQFLRDVSCDALDRTRLHSTKRITSTAHLARRIKEFTLYLDPGVEMYPGRFSLAAPSDRTHWEAQLAARKDYSLDHHSQFRTTKADQVLIASIMRDLASTPTCEISVWLDHPRSADRLRTLSYGTAVSYDIMCAVFASGSKLHHLTICDASLMDLDLLSRTKAHELARLADSLHTLEISFTMEDRTAFGTERAVQAAVLRRSALSTILRHATCLEELEVSGFFAFNDSGSVLSSRGNTEMTQMLFATPYAAMLCSLDLFALSFRESDLLGIIGHCGENLTAVNISTVELVEWDDHWMAVFRLLRDLTRLDSIELCDLRRVHTGKCQVLKLAEDNDGKDVRDVERSAHGESAVRLLLAAQIEKGIVYEERQA